MGFVLKNFDFIRGNLDLDLVYLDGYLSFGNLVDLNHLIVCSRPVISQL